MMKQRRFSTFSVFTLGILAGLGGSSAVLADGPSLSAGSRAIALSDASHRLDEEVQSRLQAAQADEYVPVLVFLADRVDLRALEARFDADRARLAERHETVVRALQKKAAETQADLLDHLWAAADRGDVVGVKPFWIVNAVAVQAKPAEVLRLAQRGDVGIIFADYQVEHVGEVSRVPSDGGDDGLRAGPEKGLIAIRAPEVWEDFGFDGTGVLTSNNDTGVDGNHPALKDRWRGVADERYKDNPEWAFFDPTTKKTFPFDTNGHGTHTMGTVVGGDPGKEIGAAPGAQWIAICWTWDGNVDHFVRDVVAGFEWLADPDGDPSTNWDVPTANSNSWRLNSGFGKPPCDESFWEAIDGCEAAGIVILFSAGNEGPGKETLGNPPDRATSDYNVFSVGAVDGNIDSWPIADFSSRGPSHCTDDGSETIKPELSAPGVNVNSSLPGNQYGQLSGTSMASPHVNGVATLMRQANPDLPVDELKQIMIDSCIDLGKDGEDNDYGHGMIDAYVAVERAIASAGVQFKYPNGRPRTIDPLGGYKLRVEVLDGPSDELIDGSAKFWVNVGDGFVEGRLVEVETNVYDAVFPRCPCDVTFQYYVTADGASGKTYTSPAGAPKNYYSATPINATGPIFVENFEQTGSWTAKKENGVTSGLWQRGVPVNDPGWGYDPESDGDGSGSCWVTQNENGATDVDGGGVLLLSPAFDLREAVAISYRYYYNEALDSKGEDSLLFEMSATGERNSWKQINRHTDSQGLKWTQVEVSREQIEAAGLKVGATMYLRFTAADRGDWSTVEAGIDDFEIIGATCVEPPPGKPGDMNCDGGVDFDDVDPFVTAITSESEYQSQYPDCRYLNGDVNGDGSVTFDDIDPFVACLVDGGC